MLMQAVVRVADARTPDADLLDRFVCHRDERAFEELVRRHGALVWAVCRQLLPHHADAEDAFQAVFLALVRGAASIRSSQALPAWLHGVAVRVAMKARRSAARRRQREERAAVPEANRPVPDESWAALMTAVHEEIRHLPETERTAFVLCDLEGVRQPDAAARLGWPLGTLSGRLCKARQRLLDQLTRRGIAPAVLAIGGLAGSAGTVPASLLKQVNSFSTAKVGVSSTVAELARGLLEGTTMRTKMLAATLLLAGALGMSGGAFVLSQDEGKSGSAGSAGGPPAGAPAGLGAGPPPGAGGGEGGLPPGLGGGRGFPPGLGGPQPGGLPGVGGPGAPPSADPAFAQPGGSRPPRRDSGFGPPATASAAGTWEYKFIDGMSNRKEFEQTLIQQGKDGWEYVGSEVLAARGGGERVLVFKKHKGGQIVRGGMMGFPGGAGALFGGGGMGSGGSTLGSNLSGLLGGGGFGGNEGSGFGSGFGGFGSSGTASSMEARTFKLKHMDADDLVKAIEKSPAIKGKAVHLIPRTGTNSIIISGDPAVVKEVGIIIEKMDASPRPVPTGPVRPGAGSGSSSSSSGSGAFAPGGSGGGGAFGPGGGVGGGGGRRGPSAAAGGPGGTTGTSGRGAMGAGMAGGGTMPPGGVAPRAGGIKVVSLKHAAAPDLATVLSRVFPQADVTPEPRSNKLIIRADDDTQLQLAALIQQLDVEGSGGR